MSWNQGQGEVDAPGLTPLPLQPLPGCSRRRLKPPDQHLLFSGGTGSRSWHMPLLMPLKAARTSITDLTPGFQVSGQQCRGSQRPRLDVLGGRPRQGPLLAARPQLSSVSRDDRAISPTGRLPGSEATWTCQHLAD